MTILAFDTTLGACSAAVLTGSPARLARRRELRERGHAEVLMGMIVQVMQEAETDFADLDRIAVTVGPGTFTGTRIGVAAARGLGLASGVPLVGATGLQVMARQALETHGGDGADALAVAIDARRDQIYFQLFDGAGGALSPPLALSPDAAGRRLPQGRVLAVGSGGALLARAAETGRVTAALPGLQPDAAVLAMLASELSPSAAALKPLYLRPPDTKPQRIGPP